MANINFDIVKDKFVDLAVAITAKSTYGLQMSDDDVCRLNAFNVLSNMDGQTDIETENIQSLYNKLIWN